MGSPGCSGILQRRVDLLSLLFGLAYRRRKALDPLLECALLVLEPLSPFFEIGLQGSASLAVVAPGMAEALSTTAFGLGAAIPAVIAYNYFNSRLNGVERELERFVAELAVVLTADNESRPA